MNVAKETVVIMQTLFSVVHEPLKQLIVNTVYVLCEVCSEAKEATLSVQYNVAAFD